MSSRSDHCHCERTVRELFSPQFPFSQRVRSMKSVSFAMCNVASWKAGVFQTHESLCQEDSWFLVADAAAWQASFKPIDGHQGSWYRHVVFPTIFLSNAAAICQQVQWHGWFRTSCSDESNSCNDKVPLWLMWRTRSPKQFCQRASCSICHYWKTEHFPPTESSSHLSSKFAGHCTEYRGFLM